MGGYAHAEKPEGECLARRALAKWSREELNKLREVGHSVLEKREKLGVLLTELSASRALNDSFSRNKMLISAKFPLRIPYATPTDATAFSFIDTLPLFLEVQETWIFFEDKSVLFVCAPSDETRATARFIDEMSRSKNALSLLDINPKELAQLGESVAIGNMKRYVVPLSRSEFNNLIESRLKHTYPETAEPSFWINLSERAVGQNEMLSYLVQASESDTDSSALAIDAKISAIAEKAFMESKT